MSGLVLDSAALSRLINAGPGETTIRAAMTAARNLGSNVIAPAAVLAEMYRGGRHDQALDSYLSRDEPIEVTPTDRNLASRVGNILARAGRGSQDHVDACVVAACLRAGGGVILTMDLADVPVLSADYPGISVETLS